MNRMDDYEHELDGQFTQDRRPASGRDHSPKGKKKRWIPLTAVLTALLVAAVTVISVSAGSAEGTEKEQVSLTLAEMDLSDGSAQEASDTKLAGYVLTDVSDVVDEVLPSVVSITSRSLVNYYGNSGFFGNGGYPGDMGDLWDIFFGDSYGGRSRGEYHREVPDDENEALPEESEEVETGMGSGTIIGQNSSELLILTSYHVVEGCSSLYVTFVNDANVDGYVKAADYDNDIAIVAIPLSDIDEETMNSIKIATISTQEPDVGDGCLVIGNALGYGISVTSGIISKTDRQLYAENRTLDVIQTDAAINFGNSGGCMVNEHGEIIGIAEAKTTGSYAEGMCYAIPVARNIELIQDLMNAEEPFDENAVQNSASNGAFLGIRGRDVNQELSSEFEMPVGIYISSVVPGSGAEAAGIQSGDIITSVEGEDIVTMAELQYLLSGYEAGDTIKLSIERLHEGMYETVEMEVTLTDRIS